MQSIAKFFIYNGPMVLSYPFEGSIKCSFHLYNLCNNAIDYDHYLGSLKQLQLITDCFSISDWNDHWAKLLAIKSILLQLYLEPLKTFNSHRFNDSSISLERLLKALDPPDREDDLFSTTTRQAQLKKLNQLLESPSTRLSLVKERLQQTTKIKPFYEICTSKRHTDILISSVDPRSFDLKDSARRNLASQIGVIEATSLLQCIDTKIHFVPIIQEQTDIKLGDCSYLDTCHKLNTCRYLHYRQLIPKFKESKLVKEHNDAIELNRQITNFTWGFPISECTRKVRCIPPFVTTKTNKRSKCHCNGSIAISESWISNL